MPSWTAIIIHHSASMDDGYKNDWEAIRSFHMSWRYNDESVDEKTAERLRERGFVVIPPWRDIGYHNGIEMVKGKIVVQQGRPLTDTGVHCKGMNYHALGLCFVGDYDSEKPSDAMYYTGAMVCRAYMAQFPGIKQDHIFPHRDFASKSCPGNLFDMDRLLYYIRTVNGI